VAIPSSVILIWPSTNASIPAGWQRETALDEKYPKAWGAATAPNNTGGSNVHTHTGAHTHTADSHIHAVTYNQVSDITDAQIGSDIPSAHGHAGSNTGGLTGGGLISATVTWSSVNQEPPYYPVIFIKPSGAVGVIAAGICSHYYGASVPTGWFYCDGANGTPDLRDRYLKGALAGNDSGATGGANSHLHSVTHGHTANAHSHTGTTGAQDQPARMRQDGGSNINEYNHATHTHPVTLNNTTDGVSDYTKIDAGDGTIDLAYKKLGVIKFASGGLKKGLVAMWLGSVASIPKDWVVCDGTNSTPDLRDKFVKIGQTLANNSETGGANTHTHSAVAHTHIATGTHTHTGSTSIASPTDLGRNAGSDGRVAGGHTHTLNSIDSKTITYQNSNASADTVDHQPAYKTVAYIQLANIPAGGAMVFC